MLSIFRKNSFFNSLMLLVYAIVLQIIPAIWGHQFYDQVPLGGPFTPVFHILLLFVQAVFINKMVIENRLHREIMLFPGLFFILFSSLIPPFWGMSHIHLANFFVIWGLFELFQIYKTGNPAIHIFNASFLIGIASIICPPVAIYLLLIFLGINNLKKMELVHILQIFIGGFIPWFLWITFKIWNGHESDITQVLPAHFGNNFFKFSGSPLDYVYLIVFGVLCLYLLVSFNEIRKKKHIQAQKKVDILFLSLITSLVVLIFHQYLDNSVLLFTVPYIGIFIGLQFSNIRNNGVAEMLHFILFATIIIYQILTYFKFS
ncbi:MAG: hypothetical protein ABI844_03580 [Saprospiraceae bacterium]